MPQVSPLQSLLSGEPLPTAPKFQAEWSLRKTQLEQERFNTQFLDYVRRLLQRLTGANIIQEIIQTVEPVNVDVLVDTQYDAGTHKLQKKTQTIGVITLGTISAWTNWGGTQPTQVTNLTDWQYDATTHKFQFKTRTEYVFEAAAASAFTDSSGTQPSSTTVVTDWQYTVGTHKFQQNTKTVYGLEFSAASGLANTSGGQPTKMDFVQTSTNYDTTTHVLDKTRSADVYVLDLGGSATTTVDTAVVCT